MNLETELEKIFRLSPEKKKTLKKMNLLTVADLLYHFPTRYGDFAKILPIAELRDGDRANIFAEVVAIKSSKTFKNNLPITEAILLDSSGEELRAIWFSQPYIAKMLAVGSRAKFSGAISLKKGKKIITNPEYEKIAKIPLDKTGSLFENEKNEDPTLFPIYKESGIKNGKISSK